MIIMLPNACIIDTLSPPENLEELVCESFSKFTSCTRKEYTYQDKLLYIDNLTRTYMQPDGDLDADAEVRKLIKDTVEWNLDEYGALPSARDYNCMEFMTQCFEAGERATRLCVNDREPQGSHANDKTLMALVRIIKAVMNWEPEYERH